MNLAYLYLYDITYCGITQIRLYLFHVRKLFWKKIRTPPKSRPHSSPDPSCGREISRGKAKNPFPQKKRFSLCRVRIEAPRTARILGGQNPERKTPFPFSRKNPPPPNQKCKECFFFRGCWRTRQCVGLSPSVGFNSEPPRAPRVAH